jgi:hypothetical protein
MGKVNPDRGRRQPSQGGAQIVVLGDRILGPHNGEGSIECDVFVHQQPRACPSIEPV